MPTSPYLRAFALLTLAALTSGCAAADPGAETDETIEDESESALAGLPEGCPKRARVFTYDPRGWGRLADAFAENPSPCADYHIHLPALAGDKTWPRGPGAVEEIHARGPRFHALAEFHFGEWSKVTSMSWLAKGREFRKRMLARGYLPSRDAWAINELPSSVRGNDEVRQNVRDLVRGLYEGPAGSPPNGGLVFVIGMGTQTQNFSEYKPAMKDWTLDAGFWADMDKHVRWWGQETYVRPREVCVGSATAAQRAERINDFTMHPARLAAAGPAGAKAARRFFDESYTPIMNGFWHSEVYGTETIGLDDMKAHVSSQIYAARLWADTHASPDWHLGVAWNEQLDGATDAQLTELAERIASAIRHGYGDEGKGASRACSPSGAYTYCDCSVAGAAFNDKWKTFASW